MELKKSPKANLENKKGLFLQIGLCISLLCIVAIFAWSQSEKKIDQLNKTVEVIDTELTDVTVQDQKPPEPIVKQNIVVVSDIINVVKNDVKIESNMTFEDFGEDVAIVPRAVGVHEEKVDDDVPFVNVELMPSFQGGDINKFRLWVLERARYPDLARDNNITGTVTLKFVIERDGTLTNVEVLRSPDKSLSDEAIRVVKSSPKWSPGKQRNIPVRVSYTLPVQFVLQ